MNIKPPETGILAARTRFLLLVLVVLCLMINWANILTFNFTVICMAPKKNTTEPSEFVTIPPPPHVRTAEFTSYEKSQAMAVVAAGALVANIPIVTLINWYGPRYLFTAVGLFGAIATALVPSAMNLGYNWFLATRVLQGIAFAGDMATFGHFVTYWTYHKQYAFFTATLCVYVQLGILCESSIGWPGVYYFHAIVAAVLFTTFFFCYRNDPNKHPYVNDLERNKIARGRDLDNAKAQMSIPYREILQCPAAWAVFIGAVGNFAGINLIFQFTPTYLSKGEIEAKGRDATISESIKPVYGLWRKVKLGRRTPKFKGKREEIEDNSSKIHHLRRKKARKKPKNGYISRLAVQGFEVVKTGFMAALPPLLQAVMKELAGLSNDRIPKRIMGETIKTRLYNSIAFISMAFFLVILSFIPQGSGLTALSIIVAGSTMLGFNIGGFYKSGSIIAGPYAPFVLGQVSTAMTVTMLIIPLIVNPLTPNNTREEWALAFYAVAAIMVACNLFYVFFARGDLCYWATAKYYQERMAKQALIKSNKVYSVESLPPKSALSELPPVDTPVAA
ncbi:major facilitator superfamily domain-containing protein [Ditylenchus destructor]|uniref:Major facilitator superfamily domain-containing protein n=1 Tax=Ditylenchus destructor TaxID=166010 RepID=A0AAD4R6D7_9BILA|nr:major facilitator superfamily domain-containing protein [Ditylenchus destructor]